MTRYAPWTPTPPEQLSDEFDVAKAEYVLDAHRYVDERGSRRWERLGTVANGFVAAAVAIAATVVSCTQLKLSRNDDYRKEKEQGLKEREDKRHDVELNTKLDAARDARSQLWFKSILDNEPKVFSDDPSVRCRMRKMLRVLVGDEYFQQSYALLDINASFCDSPAQLAVAIQSRADGAPPGYTRRDVTGASLIYECPLVSGAHDGNAKGSCSLPDDLIRQKARIYNVEYACLSGRTCGWSYNPNPALGYAKAIELAPGGVSFVWHRNRDGDTVMERYTVFYEKPAS